jgi:RimJ/RimL family protein N-acetyltransferase
MQRARDEGVPTIFLEMYAGNEAGRRTYSALGFTEVGRYRSGLLSDPATRPV